MKGFSGMMAGSIAVFYREMLLFKKKVMKLGYVFSSIFFPIVYLLAFGLGLSGRISVGNMEYIEFLMPGITAMTSMTNSFNSVSVSLSMGRLYFKNFQVIALSPVSYWSIMVGVVLSGMTRGIFAAFMIMLIGLLIFQVFPFTLFAVPALLLNTFLFASLGTVVGMIVRDPEDIALYTNFIIMPMAFFSGTFFPIDNLSVLVKSIVMFLPLSHTNILMRSSNIDAEAVLSTAVLLVLVAITFLQGLRLIKNYEE